MTSALTSHPFIVLSSNAPIITYLNHCACRFYSPFSPVLSQITFDSPDLESHTATSSEIIECCKDIKVLGRKELRYEMICLVDGDLFTVWYDSCMVIILF